MKLTATELDEWRNLLAKMEVELIIHDQMLAEARKEQARWNLKAQFHTSTGNGWPTMVL